VAEMIAVSVKYALKVNTPTTIASERQYEEYLSVLSKLESKADPTNEEERYAVVLMTRIEAYEEENHTIPNISPVEVLRTLMEANNLRQKDLAPIFGSESIVSAILHKKRDLSKIHIEKLSKRFRFSLWSFSNHRGHLTFGSANSTRYKEMAIFELQN
jgi:HTH-type transcriptional regulator/antitoxin HigA